MVTESLPKYTKLPTNNININQYPQQINGQLMELQHQSESEQERDQSESQSGHIHQGQERDLEVGPNNDSSLTTCLECEELKQKLKEKNNEIAKIIFVFLLISLCFFAFIISGPRHHHRP